MKPTPGPWSFEDADNRHMVTAGKDKKGRFIYVCDPSYSPRLEERANAAIIHAAPEMYEVCKLLRSSCGILDTMGRRKQKIDEAIKLAKIALTKMKICRFK